MKTKKQLPISDGIEALRDVGTPVAETVSKEANASIDELWKQLLGAEKKIEKLQGDLMAGQEITFGKSAHHAETPKHQEVAHHAEAPKPERRTAAGIDYHAEILHGEKRISKETEQILSQQIEQIVMELKQLVSTSQELAVEFKDVVVDQHITKPGKYHVTLFSFILTIVKQARQKIEHSGAWLNTAKGRKGKQGYWDMFAQQGTSFSMNNERAIATQAG